MKKEYMKPAISVELFTMSQSIAHNCGHNLDWSLATTKYISSCGWDIDGTSGDATVFLYEGSCTVLTEEFEGVCYNNPDGGYNVFNS